MLYKRQKELLYIISRLGSAGKTQLQKLEFLACLGIDKPTYSFFPYKFGPYSLILQKDLDYLLTNGFLCFEDEHYTSAVTEQMEIDPSRLEMINETIQRFGEYSATRLMAYIYSTYPYFAINSERAQELLSGKQLHIVQERNPNTRTPHLFTIGYEGKSIDEYLGILIQEGIQLLIDVRSNGVSMKPEFSSNRLAGYCALVGIRYKHYPAVGIASNKRKGVSDKASLFREYGYELRNEKANELKQVHDDVLFCKRVAITCFERNPLDCHRHVFVEELISRFSMEIGLRHL